MDGFKLDQLTVEASMSDPNPTHQSVALDDRIYYHKETKSHFGILYLFQPIDQGWG